MPDKRLSTDQGDWLVDAQVVPWLQQTVMESRPEPDLTDDTQ